MAFDLDQWTGLEFRGTPIYVRPDGPDWSVPGSEGDGALRRLGPVCPLFA